MQKLIDIAKIFKDKNPKAYKWTPNFLINYIRKIVHEDDINRFHYEAKDKYEFEYLNAALKELKTQITYEGLENIPSESKFILASNHPLGGLDGVALAQVVAYKRKDFHFLVNDILTYLNFGKLFVPVNKVGSNGTENIRRIEEIFAGPNNVLIFPAGLVSRRKNNLIQDLEWNKSFIAKAIKYEKDVIPVYIKGRLSNWFYNLSSFRKMLGITANIEMLYLADEMYKQSKKQIHIVIGKPISYKLFTKDKNPKEWAQLVKTHVYALAVNKDAVFMNSRS
jgi:putative hemolysin